MPHRQTGRVVSCRLTSAMPSHLRHISLDPPLPHARLRSVQQARRVNSSGAMHADTPHRCCKWDGERAVRASRDRRLAWYWPCRHAVEWCAHSRVEQGSAPSAAGRRALVLVAGMPSCVGMMPLLRRARLSVTSSVESAPRQHCNECCSTSSPGVAAQCVVHQAVSMSVSRWPAE